MSQQEQFKVDGTPIRTPFTYKPVFSVTSTEDSDRTQDLIMKNTVMGIISGYDMTWEVLEWDELATIMNTMMIQPPTVMEPLARPKDSFLFHHPSPLVPFTWIDSRFYVADYNMEAQDLSDGVGKWRNLTISVRSINPVDVNGGVS